MRQIILDTETTGLEPQLGHRIIEIGCVELISRKFTQRRYHQYLNPEREIDEGAVEVHGITLESLKDKPKFADVVLEFIEFVKDAELIIHNAPFDVAFLNMELQRCGHAPLETICQITDTLALAREKHPGQKNSLDALCKRYDVDNSQRSLHGALLDAEILGEVYLAMTGGQAALTFDEFEQRATAESTFRLSADRQPFKVIRATMEELKEHESYLEMIEKTSGTCVWKQTSQQDENR